MFRAQRRKSCKNFYTDTKKGINKEIEIYQNFNFHLDVISPSVAQSARLLKAAVGNGKVYVRPIQKNLDLSIDKAIPPNEVSY